MSAPIANASVAILIGAALSSGFNAAFGQATSKIATIGSALSTLRAKSEQLDGLRAAAAKVGNSVDVLTSRMVKQSAAAQRDSARVDELKQKIQQTGDPTGKLAVRLDAAEQKALRTGEALKQTDAALVKAKADFAAASATAESFAAANAHVGAALARVDVAYRAHERAQEAVRANDEKLARYRGKIVEYFAMGEGIKKLVELAAEREEAVIHLKWVLRSENPEQAVGKALEQAKAFARTSLATVPEMLKIQAVLSREGFDADVGRLAAETSHKVATITEQDTTETTKVIAQLYNATAKTMTGAPEEKFKHLGDLVAQLQHQFQFEGGVTAIGGQLSAALPIMQAFHVPLEQAGAAMGVLNQRGLDAGKLPMVFAKLDKAAQDIGFSLVRGKNGGLDFIGTIRAMNGALLSTYGSIDAGRDAIMKSFGARGGGAIMLALAKDTAKVRMEQERMAKEMPGAVARDYDEILHSTEGMLTQIKKSFQNLLRPIGASLIPGLKAILEPLASVAAGIGSFLEKHQVLAKVIGMGTVAFLALAVSMFAVGYAATFIQGGWLRSVALLRRLQLELAVARTGFLGLAAAEATEGEAAAASGVGATVGRSLGSLRGAGGVLPGTFARIFGAIGAAAMTVFTPSFWMRLFSGATAAARGASGAIVGVLTATGPAMGRGLAAAGRGVAAAGPAIGRGAVALPGIASGAAMGLAGGIRGLVTLAWLPGLIAGLKAAGAAIASFFAGVSAPVVIGVALVVSAALLIYKYWRPIGAFFKGFWEGLKQGLAPIGEAFRAAFEPIAKALAPAWNMLKGFFSWLLKSTGMSDEEFKKAFSSGIWWGQKLGAVLGLAFTTVFSAIGAVIMSLITVSKLLYHIATFQWGKVGEDAKAWGSYMADAGKNIGKAFSNVFASPDYSAADRKRDVDLDAPESPKAVGEAVREIEGHPQLNVIGSAGRQNGKSRGGTVGLKVVGAPKPSVGSQHALGFSKLSTIRIPKMATGGLLTRETILIGGEAGREAVIPLQRPAAMLAIGTALATALLSVAPTARPPAPTEIIRSLGGPGPRTSSLPPSPGTSPVVAAIAQIQQAQSDSHQAPREMPVLQLNAPITVNPSPGMDERKIAREVRIQLEDFVRAHEARRRGGQHD